MMIKRWCFLICCLLLKTYAQQISPSEEIIKIITNDDQETVIPLKIAQQLPLLVRAIKFNQHQQKGNQPIILEQFDKDQLQVILSFIPSIIQLNIPSLKKELDNYDDESLANIAHFSDFLEIKILVQLCAKILAERIVFSQLHQYPNFDYLLLDETLKKSLLSHIFHLILPYLTFQVPMVVDLYDKTIKNSHNNIITSLDFSNDDTILATGSTDKNVKLWNTKDGVLIDTLKHTAIVNILVFNPKNKQLAVGYADGSTIIWDAYTYKPSFIFLSPDGHIKPIMTLAFSSDGKILATGSNDNTAKIWDMNEGKLLYTFSGHTGAIRAVAFSPDNKILATGSWDNTIKIWNISTGELLKTLSGHIRSVRALTFSPNGQLLASGSGDNSIKLWQTKNFEAPVTFKDAHKDVIKALFFTKDGKYLISESFDNSAKVWDVINEKLMQTFDSKVTAIALNLDQKFIALGFSDGLINVDELLTGQLVKKYEHLLGHRKEITGLKFSHYNKIIASTAHNNAKLWHFAVDEIIKAAHECTLPQIMLMIFAYKAAHEHTTFTINSHYLLDAYNTLPAIIRKIISSFMKIELSNETA